MNEEIKEILEDVKRHLDYVEATKQTSIRDNEMKAMYYYITNLQEENQKLVEELEKRNTKLTKKLNAIEDIILSNFTQETFDDETYMEYHQIPEKEVREILSICQKD